MLLSICRRKSGFFAPTLNQSDCDSPMISEVGWRGRRISSNFGNSTKSPTLLRHRLCSPGIGGWLPRSMIRAASAWGVRGRKDQSRSSLRKALCELEIFYNRERPHQGIDNKIILADFNKPPSEGAIKRRSRLGGMLNIILLMLSAQ